MSKTFRRKNHECENNTSWDSQGRKFFGFYTEYDCVGYGSEDPTTYSWAKIYREPTEKEYNKAYYNTHSDKQSRKRRSGPSKWYRYMKIHKYRMHDKREIHKFMKNEDYEPMCWIRIDEGYWD